MDKRNKPEDFDRWGTPVGMTYTINGDDIEDEDEKPVAKSFNEVIQKFNPFHDKKGWFTTARGMNSYSANPKTKDGAAAIARSTAAGYGAVMNVHRESKGENIHQNNNWIKSGQKPTNSQLARAAANAPQGRYNMRMRARTNRVKGTMGATKEGAPINPRKPKTAPQAQQNQNQNQSQQTANQKPQTAAQNMNNLSTVHVTQKMKSGVTMDADFDTSKVQGALNKEFRGTAEGKDLTKNFDATKVKASDSYMGQERFTDKIADMQGFNSPPKVVSQQEFDQLAKACGDEMFRTWGTGSMDGKRLTGKGFMKAFGNNGDMKMNGPSGRVYGDGIYVTSSKMSAGRGRTYTQNDAANAKRESQYYGDGRSTTRMTWLSKPNIVTNRQLDNEWNKLSYAEKAKFGNHKNTYACAKGYDAIYTNTTEYMVIFNRSKLAIVK